LYGERIVTACANQNDKTPGLGDVRAKARARAVRQGKTIFRLADKLESVLAG
jgi:hypothetical protein